MKHLILLLAFLASSAYGAGSMNEAASQGAASIPKDASVEWCGVVSLLNGSYVASAPVTSNDDKGCEVHAKIPKGAEIVAIYHSHPDMRMSEYFSPEDVATANKLQMPVYLLVEKTGEFKVYTPGSRTVGITREAGLPSNAAMGKRV